MLWEVVLLDEISDWYEKLGSDTAEQVTAAIDLLEEQGPMLGRPLVDTLQGSIANLKELRPGSAGSSEVRILFVFDPERRAVLLVAGDKSGKWKKWYADNVPLAERRFQKWLDGEYDKER